MTQDSPGSPELPTLPLLIYDGKCGFCAAWIDSWKQITRGIAYAQYQEVQERFPEIPVENFASAVQLVLPNREVREGAHAIVTALATVPGKRWMLRAYDSLPLVAPIAEAGYGVIARHRSAAYWITKLLWGISIRRETNAGIVDIFLRMLGAIYLIAFISFGMQSKGLIGEHGILPVANILEAAQRYYGGHAYWAFPTVLWMGAGNTAIAATWIAGIACSFCILLGPVIVQRLGCVGAWVLYLSLVSAGQVFMGYQWDALLLEAGFLAMFLRWSPKIAWLLRWLLFRLMFLSGMVKLLSGDPTWRNLSALKFHYHTQPLPTPVAWYFDQLPSGVQRFSTGVTLGIELCVPFLLLLPRRPRHLAACILAGFQGLIFLTGNYTFFNLLTMALCLMAFDDSLLARFGLGAWAAKLQNRYRADVRGARRIAAGVVAGVVLFLSVSVLADGLGGFSPEWMREVAGVVRPLQIVNGYGLFAVMTTTRPEIVIEGSNDGKTWQEYEFQYKAGDLNRPPRWIAPLQPRLDWQMWFAALGSYENERWFLSFVHRLLQGDPDVLRLLRHVPSESNPPKYVRALLYEYRFTTIQEHKETGAWWHRELTGVYLPQVSLDDFGEDFEQR